MYSVTIQTEFNRSFFWRKKKKFSGKNENVSEKIKNQIVLFFYLKRTVEKESEATEQTYTFYKILTKVNIARRI